MTWPLLTFWVVPMVCACRLVVVLAPFTVVVAVVAPAGRRIRYRAQPGNADPVLVPAEPVHAEIPLRGAVDLEKAHLQHHLLGGRDLHRIDDGRLPRLVFRRYYACGDFNRARRSDARRSPRRSAPLARSRWRRLMFPDAGAR